MRGYRAFGLTFTSDVPLKGWFAESEIGEPDFSIRLASCVSRSPKAPDPRRGIHFLEANEERCTLSWSGIADITISGATVIDIVPSSESDQDAIRLFISGAAIGVLLHQRGYLVLHGSAVAFDDRGAAAFLGPKGSGKSTTAVALQSAGHRLISEELLVLQPDSTGHGLIALPSGCPAKIWGNVASVLESSFGPLVPVRRGVDKYFVPQLSPQSSAVLRHVFLLDVGDAIELEHIAPIDRFLHVAANLYVQRFGTEFVQAVGAGNAFKLVAKLVKETFVSRLVRTNNLDRLPDLSRFIASSFGFSERQSAL